MSKCTEHNKYHRFKKNGKQYYEHRVIMEEKLGRKLLSTEIVHHIDGNHTNNNPNNLEITTNSIHVKNHRKAPEYTIIICPVCKKEKTYRTKYHEWHKHKYPKRKFHCSRKCAGINNKKIKPRSYNGY